MTASLNTVGGSPRTYRHEYSEKLIHGEHVILTTNQKGVASPEELLISPKFHILFNDGAFSGFCDEASKTLYKNPTALCKHSFARSGSTNEWNGPMHCLVKRGEAWVSLYSIFNSSRGTP
jgi:hypothetical protein